MADKNSYYIGNVDKPILNETSENTSDNLTKKFKCEYEPSRFGNGKYRCRQTTIGGKKKINKSKRNKLNKKKSKRNTLKKYIKKRKY